MLLYAYLTYAALGLAYSLVNIPYGSLAGAMTRNRASARSSASARTIGAVIVGADARHLRRPADHARPRPADALHRR